MQLGWKKQNRDHVKLGPKAQDSSYLSTRVLLYCFLVAFVLFSLLQWPAGAYVKDQIIKQAKQQGIELHMQSFDLHGLNADATGITLGLPARAISLTVESLQLSFDGSALWHGQLGMHVMLRFRGQTAQADVLYLGQQKLALRHLDAAFDVQAVQGLWKPFMSFPIDLAGHARLQGGLLFDLGTMASPEGELRLSWQSLAISLTDLSKPLGDYVLQAEGKRQQWQWSLAGGTALLAVGQGQLQGHGNRLAAWKVSGKMQLQDAGLSHLISGLMQQDHLSLRLSGSLAQPVLRPVL